MNAEIFQGLQFPDCNYNLLVQSLVQKDFTKYFQVLWLQDIVSSLDSIWICLKWFVMLETNYLFSSLMKPKKKFAKIIWKIIMKLYDNNMMEASTVGRASQLAFGSILWVVFLIMRNLTFKWIYGNSSIELKVYIPHFFLHR